MAKTQIDAKTRQAVIDAKDSGLSCQEVAEMYGVSKSYVDNVGKKSWQTKFQREWANIYPGDEVRKQLKAEGKVPPLTNEE